MNKNKEYINQKDQQIKSKIVSVIHVKLYTGNEHASVSITFAVFIIFRSRSFDYRQNTSYTFIRI